MRRLNEVTCVAGFSGLLWLVVVGAAFGAEASETSKEVELLEVRKIWNGAPHNAFTDLARFKDRWYTAFREFLRLPSGDDTSYPGLVLHEGILWMSYYSSHEGRTSIYLAKVRFASDEQ